jgi:hypothetical protein
MTPRLLLIPAVAVLLAACDIPGMGPDPRIAQRESDARAIGGACRHALRGIEDCYRMNEKASKTAVFEGWKEMDQYMRENKIEGQHASVEVAEKEEIIEDKRPTDEGKEKTANAKPRSGKTSAGSDKI